MRSAPVPPVIGAACLLALAAVVPCQTADAGDSGVPANSGTMQSVVVTARRLKVQTLIDRKVYSVAPDLQSTFGSLGDILSVIPSVAVDPDGNVSLRGDKQVTILIDGKPSNEFAGSLAGENIQSIPAKDIERIEILTTPPAQFKADGAAGIINIIMRKKSPRGVSGSLNAGGSSGRTVIGSTGGYSSGPLTVSINAGYREDYRHRLTESQVITPGTTAPERTDSSSIIDERKHRATRTVGLSAEYALNALQSISLSTNLEDRGGPRGYTEVNDTTLYPPGAITSSTQRLSYGHDPRMDVDETLEFKQTLRSPGETLDLSLHRSASNQHEHYDYTNTPLIPPSAAYYNNLSFHEVRGTNDLAADYRLPTSKTTSLKLGYDFEQDNYSLANLGNNVDPLTGAQIVDPNLTDDFQFRREIHAAYASFQGSAGAWVWTGGLRLELTRTDAGQLTNGLSTTGSYLRLYPSVHVDRSLSSRSTLSFNASRRVTRPDPEDLNPYVDNEYTPNLTGGNPNLKPEYTQSYEVAYGFQARKVTLDATGYYRANRDSVTVVTEYLGNGVSLTTKANLPRDDDAGMEFSVTGSIAPELSYSLSGDLFYNQIVATAPGVAGLRSTAGLDAKAELDYDPTGSDSLQINFSRTDKRLTPQGYITAIDVVNLAYKHDLRGNWTAVTTVGDLFNGQRYRRTAITAAFTDTYERVYDGRVLYLGFTYTFKSANHPP